ncbi:bifunctional DNA-formamidopyrimidine glycosylase/DNA-(apurinic or apyrimidinic site) lyase [Nocardioides yefusunii]|uniref:Formamidopyrimidine-DNA glycosylase n=1 Tax=Nocardioides yefusunii TaxID=2500546 RepID=A0ABW1QV94_9ACTN|nr:bifunctional DNA-formamidopyrimidine glycosylase/DNA-(apurinic or apyrimidinic site) lyase [Nocardioides yefusunii]
MPELPEVEVVRRGLERHVVGSTVHAVEVLHDRPVRREAGGASSFVQHMTGRTVSAVRRRGKYFWLALDGDDAMLGHLGMSGQMLLKSAGAPDERHLRVRFVLDDGMEMRFVDQRMFGGLSYAPGGAELPAEIAHIGRDPLDEQFDLADVARRMRRRTVAVKRQLLDQNLVSGVGNIYADEALWRARLNGERPGDRLTQTQAVDVLGRAQEVMLAALDEGGTSFDALYVNVNGESGYFDRSLKAYGQEDRACERCGTAIVRVAFMNRSSYYCPKCQPKPRARRS